MQQEEKCSLSARLAIPQKYVLSKGSMELHDAEFSPCPLPLLNESDRTKGAKHGSRHFLAQKGPRSIRE